MPVRTARPRVTPVWSFALRKGPIRNTIMPLLERSPYDMERLLEMDAEMRARGWVPVVPHVREPFDAPHRFSPHG